MKTLDLAKGISLPLDIVTQTIAILAKRRAGKSYTMRKLVEQLLTANQQVIMVDPKGDQWGIRSSADGKRPGFPIVILGGEHGDAPLEVSAGEVVAKLVVEERVSVLLDLSVFRKHEIATFMTAFLENLYRLKAQEAYRTPVMLVIDEADAIAPQKPQKGEERMLGAAEDIVRRGGQRGIGCALITQRSAVLNKNVLTQAQMLIVLRTIAPQDLAAMKAWIDVHGTLEEGKTLMDSLPSLPIGDAWFWSPGWPTESGIFERAHVRAIETFDSGATPAPGQKQIIPKNLADVDLEALKKQMHATIEKAKNDDPRLLRKRIAELEKGNAESKNIAQPLVDSKQQVKETRVEVPVLKDSQIKALDKIAERMYTEAERHGNAMALLWGNFDEIGKSMQKAMESLADFQKRKMMISSSTKIMPETILPGAIIQTQKVQYEETGGLTGPEQKVINGIGWMVLAGTTSPEQTLVATLAGYSVYSSSFVKALSLLRTKGLIESQGKKVWLTEQGDSLVQEPSSRPTRAELHEKLIDKLDGPSGKIMRALLKAEGAQVNDDDLAAASEYSPFSSSYIKAKSILRGKDLMESEGKMHAARDILFI